MKRLLALVLLLPTLLLAPFAGAAEPPPQLAEAGRQVAAEFARLDAALQRAAGRLSALGLTGPEARAVLAGLCAERPYAIDCAALDAKGVMVTVVPDAYRAFEGTDLHDQKQVQRLQQTGRPVLSTVFRSVEGTEAADVQYPVKAADGRLLGAVSLLFRPERLLQGVIVPLTAGTPLAIWAMDGDGRILYEADPGQVGLNLFTAELYRPYGELVALGRRIVAEPTGNGVYHFVQAPTTRVVKKEAAWQTVELYDGKWRLVAITIEPPR